MRVLPTLALLGVTAAWGSTFFMIKDLLHQISVLDFLSIRFAIAAVVLWAISPRSVGRLSADELRHGAVLGLVYGVAQVLQTTGLERTPATVSGFAVSFGVVIIFASAMLYALHIIGLGLWSKDTNVFGLAVVQMVVIALICTVFTAPNGIETPQTVGGWSALLYMAVVSGALAMLGQTWAQAHMSSARAAIIMTMEPVWAAFFAVLFGGESLTARMLVGGALVLTAMYIVELAPRRRKVEAEVPHLTG